MFLCFEQKEQELGNLEDESEDDLRLLGISHPKGTRLALKILRSEPELKEGGFRRLVLKKKKGVQTGESLDHSYAGTWWTGIPDAPVAW